MPWKLYFGFPDTTVPLQQKQAILCIINFCLLAILLMIDNLFCW